MRGQRRDNSLFVFRASNRAPGADIRLDAALAIGAELPLSLFQGAALSLSMYAGRQSGALCPIELISKLNAGQAKLVEKNHHHLNNFSIDCRRNRRHQALPAPI